MTDPDRPLGSTTTRNFANYGIIFTGVLLAALAIWPGNPTASRDAMSELPVPDYAWVAHGLGALLSIGAVTLGQRADRRGLARLMLVAAVVILLGALVLGGSFGPRSLLSLLLPAVVLAIAAATFGPMPAPNENVRS